MSSPTNEREEALTLDDFNGQVSVLRQLIRALFAGIWQIFSRNMVLILVLAIGLGAGGYAYKRSTPEVWAASTSLSFKYLTKKMYAGMLEKLDGLAKANDAEQLASVLGITEAQAEHIKGVDGFNLRGESLNLDINNESAPFTVVVRSTDANIYPAVQQGLTAYLDNSPFVQERMETSRQHRALEMAHYTAQAQWIDSVIAAYTNALTGTPITEPLSLSELIDKSNSIFSKVEEVRIGTEQINNIEVMDPFGPARKQGQGALPFGLMGAVVGLLLGFGIGFVRMR